MLLGSKARYAVMAMVDLARRPEGKPVTLAEIAECQEISLPYLEQIFLRLKKNGLVTPVRGPGGGYMIGRPAAQIAIGAIVAAVDESVEMTRCAAHVHQGCMADKTRCLTHDLWEGLTQHIESYLDGVTLQDVCERRLRPSPIPPAPELLAATH